MQLYKIDFNCSDEDALQNKLNYLYLYKNDICTKILHRNRLNRFYMLLRQLISNNVIESFDSAIDIGCNAGVYSKIISDFGYKKVVGIDIDYDYIEKANDSFAFDHSGKVLNYELMNAENLTADTKYDFILCTEVIEHTENPQKVVENIINILNSKGIAVITLPNRISLPYFAYVIIHKLKQKPMNKELLQHISYPFYKSLKLFQNSDLEIIQTTGTNLMLNGLLLRWLYNTPLFTIINQADFYLSRLWPFKYFTQFFFIVLKKERSNARNFK